MRMRAKRPKGLIRMYRDGVLLFEVKNLVVNAGLPAFAECFAGNSSTWKGASIGFGSGNTAPLITDTDLAGPFKYYNAIGGATFPSSGTVQFAFAIQAADYAAYGETIQELGMFANSTAVALPASAGFTYSAWTGTTAEPVGNVVTDGAGHDFRSTTPPSWTQSTVLPTGYTIIDSNGNLQQVTTPGTTKANPHPVWATTPVGATTTDNSVTWTLRAIGAYTPTSGGSAPSWVTTTIGSSLTFDGTVTPVVWTYINQTLALPTPMITHATVPSFAFTGAASYVGSWALTF